MFRIGRLGKARGIQGAIKIRLDENHFLEDLLQAEVLFVEKNGQKLPFFLEEVWGEPHPFVRFEEVNSREEVEPFASCFVFMRKEDMLPPEEKTGETEGLAYSFLEGYLLEDEQLGPVGQVIRVEEYPQQEMAILDLEGREVLIPLSDPLILFIDKQEKRLLMNLPAGILEL